MAAHHPDAGSHTVSRKDDDSQYVSLLENVAVGRGLRYSAVLKMQAPRCPDSPGR